MPILLIDINIYIVQQTSQRNAKKCSVNIIFLHYVYNYILGIGRVDKSYMS